jgi:hypothetical protein
MMTTKKFQSLLLRVQRHQYCAEAFAWKGTAEAPNLPGGVLEGLAFVCCFSVVGHLERR